MCESMKGREDVFEGCMGCFGQMKSKWSGPASWYGTGPGPGPGMAVVHIWAQSAVSLELINAVGREIHTIIN